MKIQEVKTIVIAFHPDWHNSFTQQFLFACTKPMAQTQTLVVATPADFASVKAQLLAKLPNISRVIWQFPLYWYSAPAVMHAWLEQCLDKRLQRALANKQIGLVVSLGKEKKHYQLAASENTTVDQLMQPYANIIAKLAAKMLPVFVVEPLLSLSEQAKQRLAINYQQYLALAAFDDEIQQGKWLAAKLQTTNPLVAAWLAEKIDEVGDLKEVVRLERQDSEI